MLVYDIAVIPVSCGAQRVNYTEANAVAILERTPRVLRTLLDGLSAETRDQLRVLAEASLHQLGVRTATPAFVQDEMLRQCAQLAAAIPPSAVSALERERALQAAITRAIERLEDT